MTGSIKTSELPEATTFDQNADYFVTLDTSAPINQRWSKITPANFFNGNETGNLTIGNQANGGNLYFSTKNSSAATKTVLSIDPNQNAAAINGFLSFGSPELLNISSGIITVTGSFVSIDVEGGTDATDNLDTINPSTGNAGHWLVIKPQNTDRTVVVKNSTGSGNLYLNGDFEMNSSLDRMLLLGVGASWMEISRSDNGAA